MRRRLIVASLLAGVVAAAYLYSEVAPTSRRELRMGAHYVRQWNPDVAHTARALQSAIADAVPKSGNLPAGYPRAGVVHRVPTADKSVWQVECVPSDEAAGKDGCLLLRPTGEHVQVSWRETGETDTRLYFSTVYVLGIWPWQRIDLSTTQRVVVQVEHPNDANSAAQLMSVYNAIGEALAIVGAREYRQ